MTVPRRAACDVQLAASTDEFGATRPCTTAYHDAPCAKRSGWLDRLLPPDRDDARRGSPAERKRSRATVIRSRRRPSRWRLVLDETRSHRRRLGVACLPATV